MGVPTITFGFHLIFTFITAHKKYLHPERNLQTKMLNWHKIPEKKHVLNKSANGKHWNMAGTHQYCWSGWPDQSFSLVSPSHYRTEGRN